MYVKNETFKYKSCEAKTDRWKRCLDTLKLSFWTKI